MRRVLMLNYFFPPLGGIASLRAWRFASQLPETGWEPLVVTPRCGDYYQDRGLAAPEERVVRTFSLEPSRYVRPSLRRLEGQVPSSDSSFGAVRRFVRRWIYRPDPQIGWYPFALAAARRALRDRRVDVIFSSAFPLTGHLVARKLRRETRLPWVAEFRDLWSDWGVHGNARRRWDEALERSLVAEAAAIVTVSPTYAEVFKSRGARKVAVITNGFDEGVPAAAMDVPQATVTYLGTFYPGRQDVETALSALTRLEQRSGRRPLFRLVGEPQPGLDGVLRRIVDSVAVEITGFVPKDRAAAYLGRSQALLLAGPVSCDTAALKGNVAAKTFEYLAARRPILMVGHADADVAGMLRPFRHVRVVAPGDVTGAHRALEALLHEVAAPDPAALAPFESRALTRQLGEILDAAVGQVDRGGPGS